METIINLLETQINAVNAAPDKSAAITAAFENIRKQYKLDLRFIDESEGFRDFIYKIEGVTKSIYIIGTENKELRTWDSLKIEIL